MSVPDASRAKRAAAGRMTREAWVEAGIAALMEEGIANVKIQVMARTLAVSRSSFYWFFADLQELHRELLEYWLRKNTNPIIERALRPAPTVTKAVCHIFECWVDPGFSIRGSMLQCVPGGRWMRRCARWSTRRTTSASMP